MGYTTVIRQGIKEAERGQMLQEFQSKNQELLSAKVVRVDTTTGNVTLEIGKNEAVLPKAEQVPGEELREGDMTKIFVVGIKEGEKRPRIMISRTHPGLVRRLFESEVPEIFDGTIEIKLSPVMRVHVPKLPFILRILLWMRVGLVSGCVGYVFKLSLQNCKVKKLMSLLGHQILLPSSSML